MWMRRQGGLRSAGRAAPGFTLLEVMVVTAIVAVLAAIALTSYAAYVRRSARAEAQSTLTEAASRQQQFLVDRRRYASSLSALGMAAPPDLAAKYSVTFVTQAGPPPGFTLTAQAIGDQAKDKCPTLTLDSGGTRTPTECW